MKMIRIFALAMVTVVLLSSVGFAMGSKPQHPPEEPLFSTELDKPDEELRSHSIEWLTNFKSRCASAYHLQKVWYKATANAAVMYQNDIDSGAKKVDSSRKLYLILAGNKIAVNNQIHKVCGIAIYKNRIQESIFFKEQAEALGKKVSHFFTNDEINFLASPNEYYGVETRELALFMTRIADYTTVYTPFLTELQDQRQKALDAYKANKADIDKQLDFVAADYVYQAAVEKLVRFDKVGSAVYKILCSREPTKG